MFMSHTFLTGYGVRAVDIRGVAEFCGVRFSSDHDLDREGDGLDPVIGIGRRDVQVDEKPHPTRSAETPQTFSPGPTDFFAVPSSMRPVWRGELPFGKGAAL